MMIRWKNGGLIPALLAAFLLCQGCTPNDPPKPGDIVTKAIFTRGTLWMLSLDGTLSVIREGANERIAIPAGQRVQDLISRHGRPATVSCGSEDCASWSIRTWNGATWSTDFTIRSEKEEYYEALRVDGSQNLFLTSRRLITVSDSGQRAINLSRPLNAGKVAALVMTDRYIFVGLNAGEWGGGIQRIARETGDVFTIERNSSGALCGGPLNTGCDPVNGLAIAPWKPDCLVAAIGLVHFMPHGRIVEICGTDVRRLYVKAIGTQPPNKDQHDDEPSSSVAFYGLIRQGNELWATGIDGIYRFDGTGVPQRTPTSRYRKIGGMYVNFSTPRLVLVSTLEPKASGGAIPLPVPRDAP